MYISNDAPNKAISSRAAPVLPRGYLSADATGEGEEGNISPVPRSPPRKTILETYTSPKRLGNRHAEGDPHSPFQQFSPRTGSSVNNNNNYSTTSPGRKISAGGSLVEKLQDRAGRLTSTYLDPPVPQAVAPVPYPQQSRPPFQQVTIARNVSTDVDEDSSIGTGAPRIHPYEDDDGYKTEEEEVPSAVDKYPVHAQLVSGARLQSTAPVGGIAAREHMPVSGRDQDAPPIIPPPPDKKKFTVAKSPKFALMSWQKRLNEQREAEENEKLRLETEQKKKKSTKTAGASAASNNYFGYQAPKRSDSAARRR